MKSEQTTERQLQGQAGDAQVAEWKARHKDGIYAIAVAGHIAYFKNPSRSDINCAMSKADSMRALAVYEELANLTYLGGSEAVLTEDQLFVGASQLLHEKLEGKKAVLVNL